MAKTPKIASRKKPPGTQWNRTETTGRLYDVLAGRVDVLEEVVRLIVKALKKKTKA